ncbi:MAG: TSUP family transporter [Dehalococcoidia bacterium]|nr:TSUP family transporter [Dehalococcoidia bacterium]
MLDDPWFYAAAVPALLIIGISKGGFGGGLGIVGVPLMSLVISPVQAAAILLPVLCLMDLFGVAAYRSVWDRRNMRIIVPGATAGIVLGALTFTLLSDTVVRLLIGLLAIGFTLHHWLAPRLRAAPSAARGPRVLPGVAWSGLSGYTSFIAHAGGPPISVYLLPQQMGKTLFVGTTVVFFTAVNYLKLVPYAWLGQFDVSNLLTSLALAPLAPVGIGLGLVLHRRVDEALFYRLVYAFLFGTGLKLVYDGIGGL